MAKTVIFDVEVIGKIEEIATYIEENFGKTAAVKFTQTIFKKAQSLSRFPEKGRHSQKFPEIRHINVSKINRLYYRIEDDDILIIFLFDMRQAPEKDPFQ